VNSCGFSLNYAEGEAKLSVTVNNRDGIQEHGSTEREEIRLYGVRINAQSPNSQRAEVLPIAARRFAQFGSPRIIISGGVSYSDSLLIDPGATIVFSAATADDFDGSRGLSSVVGVVRSISRNPSEQRSKVEIVYTGRNGAGWSPSMLATAAPAATKLTVEANEYSPTRHEITGETMTDASFYAVGDPDDVVRTGNYGARVSTVITAIVGSTITLGAAHGLAAPDWGTIRPQYYDLTSNALRQYVFGADDNGTLGAASIAAYVYL